MPTRAGDFTIAGDLSHAICPAGQRLYRNGRDCALKGGFRALKFRAPISACSGCALRAQCLRKPDWKLFALVHNIEKLANHRKAA